MKFHLEKLTGGNRLLIAGWILLIGFLAFQWVRLATGLALTDDRFREAAARVEKIEQEARDRTADDGGRIAALTRKSLFAPPVPPPEPPRCLAILGDTALINGEWYKVGQEVAGAKILAIDATSVTFLFQEKEVRQYPFETGGGGSPGGRPSRGSRSRPEARTSDSGAAASRRPDGPPMPGGFDGPGGFGRPGGRGFFNISPEEREQMRQRFEQMSPEERSAFREQMRERFRRENRD